MFLSHCRSIHPSLFNIALCPCYTCFKSRSSRRQKIQPIHTRFLPAHLIYCLALILLAYSFIRSTALVMVVQLATLCTFVGNAAVKSILCTYAPRMHYAPRRLPCDVMSIFKLVRSNFQLNASFLPFSLFLLLLRRWGERKDDWTVQKLLQAIAIREWYQLSLKRGELLGIYIISLVVKLLILWSLIHNLISLLHIWHRKNVIQKISTANIMC